MRQSFIITILLTNLIFLSALTVNGQTNVQPIVSVNNGDSFTYQITDMFNYEDIPFVVGDGGEEFYFSLGDTFNINVLNTILNADNEILVELETDQGSTTISNWMENLFFSFIIFTDWVYWTNYLQTIYDDGTGIDPIQDDETFGFRLGILIPFDLNDSSLGNAALDILNIYDKLTGILLYQYFSVAREESQDELLGYYEVIQGTPLPIADKNTLAINEIDLYKYEIAELIGFEDTPLFLGLDENLSVQSNDIINVSIMDRQISSNNEITLSVSTNENSIQYNNRLDFLNSISEIAFFIYTDWDYMEDIVLLINESSTEEVEITYKFSSTTFKYTESFASEDGYYNYETEYDLSNGALITQLFIFEDFNTSTFLAYEIKFLERITIDTSFTGFDLETVYTFIITQYTSSDFSPIFTSTDGNMWLFEGDLFVLSLLSAPNSNNELPVRISSSETSIVTINLLDDFGGFVVFNDWDFWRSYWQTIIIQSSQNVIITLDETDTVFSISIRIIETGFDYSESIAYEKSTGIMLSHSFDVELVNQDNELETIHLQIDRSTEVLTSISTTSVVSVSTSTPSSKADDSPGFEIYLSIISFLSLIMIIKKSKKNTYSKL